MSAAAAGHCRGCAHFDARPQSIEASFAGLSSLSSGFASVRDADGLCEYHERYVAAASHCAQFVRRSAGELQGGPLKSYA